jgi:SecD/SecF fusion protein
VPDADVQLEAIFGYSLKEKQGDVESKIREEVNDAINNSFNVLRTRIDRFGVVQPNIQRLNQAGRILIELPGIKEPERVRKLLQGSANLEFWETFDLEEFQDALSQINSEFAASAPQVEEPEKEQAEAAETDSAALAAADEAKQMAELKRNHPLFSLFVQNGGGPVVGTVHYSDTAKVMAMLNSQIAKSVLPRDLRFGWTVKPVDDRGVLFELIALKAQRNGRASLEGDVITDARAEYSQVGTSAEGSMAMNSEGSKKWQQLTKENVGKCVAIVLDGYVYSFPRVQTEIAGGRSQITGNFTIDEAKDLANTLKSGKMPAPARIIQEDVVGPSLGRESIQAGLWSFVLGFVLAAINELTLIALGAIGVSLALIYLGLKDFAKKNGGTGGGSGDPLGDILNDY